MIAKKCPSCHWFHVDARNLKQGHCHRYPPHTTAVVIGNRVAEMSIVAVVNAGYGCGEHAPRGPQDELPVLGVAEAVPANGALKA